MENCKPCVNAVVLETARHLCRIAGKQCEEEYEKAVLGEISIRDFLDIASSKVDGDEKAEGVIQAVRTMVEGDDK